MYFSTFTEMKKLLGHVLVWLDKAEAHAKAKSFDTQVLMEARLAPDQFAFVRQVQSACDTAKLGASRLTGKDAPSHPDTEKTFEELRARVRSTLAYLDTLQAQDFEGAASRIIRNPRWEGKVALGSDYFLEHAVPNFFFHLTHAYAILRHNGVDLGKRDFLGHQTRRDA